MIGKQKSSLPEERAVAGGEYGPQPLNAVMETHGLSNHDVVAAAGALVTHKMINKARRGRRLSRKVQMKVLEALNAAVRGKMAGAPETACYEFAELFNYDGR